MTKDEALKMVIDYLEYQYEIGAWGQDLEGLIDCCKEALEQPAQEVEPFDVWAGTKPQEDVPIVFPRWDNGEPFEVRYPKQSAQEPVAWIDTKADIDEAFITNELKKAHIKRNSYCDNWNIPLYTHPAPSWQGLSDDEISKLFVGSTANDFARAIEQALKEKNYG